LKILISFMGLGLLFGGCAAMAPTHTINGSHIYIRTQEEVDRYCLPRTIPEGRGASVAGCNVPKENTIMIVDGPQASLVLAHELLHIGGWDHRGPCELSYRIPAGATAAGAPCDWYRP
jgi:hypothetical protein